MLESLQLTYNGNVVINCSTPLETFTINYTFN